MAGPPVALQRKRVNLALQGGGSFGAFTWGVLDRLLEDGRLEFDGVTATSAGAMNAAVLADGLASGGREGAREALARFWRTISRRDSLHPMHGSVLEHLKRIGWAPPAFEQTPLFAWLDTVVRYFSPYEFNPFNINPLRRVLEEAVDFARLREACPLKLFVAATNVHTGRIRVFSHVELSVDAVLASACLPTLFQAVEIDGIPYWDGGYMGNPPLYPLFYETSSPDCLLVQVNPTERRATPRTTREIENRLNEITFNASLLRELRAIDFVTRLIDAGKLSADEYMRVRMHRIDGEDALAGFRASEKLNSDWSLLERLHSIGRGAAGAFLERHFDNVGKSGTLDLRATFS